MINNLKCFGATYCLHLQDIGDGRNTFLRYILTTYQTIRRHIPALCSSSKTSPPLGPISVLLAVPWVAGSQPHGPGINPKAIQVGSVVYNLALSARILVFLWELFYYSSVMRGWCGGTNHSAIVALRRLHTEANNSATLVSRTYL